MSSIKRKKKTCVGCLEEKYIFGKGLCQTCYQRQQKPIIKKPLKLKSVKKDKSMYGFSSQTELFHYIWDNNEHKCFVSGQDLEQFYGTEKWYWCFEHLISKGAFLKYKLNPDNIVLLHPDIHFMITNNSLELQDKSGYDFTKLRELKDKLKREYYGSK